jgi:hypothetical protein
VPPKDTTAGPLAESLFIVRFPVADPAVVGLNWTCSVVDWFGFNVIGKLPPTMVKPAPVIETVFTVTGAVPDDVSVNDRVAEEFTDTLPKLRLVAPSVNCEFPAEPVPLKDTTAVLPLVELLLIVSCPVVDPVAIGLNWTCNVTDWLGVNVTGNVPATMAKPAPVIETEFTVTGEVPFDVSVNDCVAAVFTVTLPKLKLVVLTVSCGLTTIVYAADPTALEVYPTAVPITLIVSVEETVSGPE